MGCWIKTYITCLLLVLSVTFGFAQAFDLVPYSKSLQTADSIGHAQALKLFQNQPDLLVGKTTFGFSENYFWLLVDVPPEIEIRKRYVLDIDNPHIDYISAWKVSDGKFSCLGQSGDRIPFQQRTVENRRNVFPVQFENHEDQLLVLADKRNASVTVPLKLWTLQTFDRHELRSNMIYGFYFGMLLLIMLYSILIFAVQRSSIYIWYTLYVFSLFMYLFTHIGYGFQFIFPSHYEWSNYLRLIMIALIVIAQIKFTQLYLPVRSVAPIIYKIFNAIIAALLGIILWWILVPGLFTSHTILVINVVYGFIALTLLLIFIVMFLCWKSARASVLFYGIAFFMNIAATLVVIAEEYGVLNTSSLPLSPLFIGSFFEILIFAIALSYRSKLIGDDRKKLLTSINSLQQQAMQSFVLGMEEEKVRVANELHDDIASRLSLLKMKVANNFDSEIAKQIAEISDGVRKISHQLNPVSLTRETFLEKMKELVSEYRKAGMSVEFQVFDFSKTIEEETGLQLYRVLQEALQNINKHAKTQEVEVQIFTHENELVMTIEDDGDGFDMENKKVGLGTKNMRMRTEQVGGEFSISSAVGDGTSIMVTVPLS